MACPKKKKSYTMKKRKYNTNYYLKLNLNNSLKIKRYRDFYEYDYMSVAFANSKLAKKYAIQLVDTI
jgi:hypothetical protein